MMGKLKAILGDAMAQIGEAELDMQVDADQCWNARLDPAVPRWNKPVAHGEVRSVCQLEFNREQGEDGTERGAEWQRNRSRAVSRWCLQEAAL